MCHALNPACTLLVLSFARLVAYVTCAHTQSFRTKKVIVELQGIDFLYPHLSSVDWVTQMYAAAAIQNMCQNVEFASSLKDRGALQLLRNLLRSTHPAVVRLAAGALKNVGDTYTLLEDAGGEGQREMGDEGTSRRSRKRSLYRGSVRRTSFALGPLSQVGSAPKPKVLRSPRVEAAINACVQEDQKRHGLEGEAATLIQTRWRGIFAREDASRLADAAREYRCAGARITNLLRRSPKGADILLIKSELRDLPLP